MKLFEEWLNQQKISEIDFIVWGKSTKINKDKINYPSKVKDWFLDNSFWFNDFINNAPKNSSSITRNDLAILMNYNTNINSIELDFAIKADNNHIGIWIDFSNKLGIEFDSIKIENILKQTDALIFYLKDLINRPRPYQLAYYYNLDLYPQIHTDANSASYPSGHAFDALLISELLSRKYPTHRNNIQELGERILKSRELVGVHYPSDSEISRKLVKLVLDNNFDDFIL